jgi:hypothetical protein
MSTIPQPEADARWYYASGRQKVGPFSLGQLRERAVAGELQPSSMVWQQGTQKWVTASSIPGLFHAVMASAKVDDAPRAASAGHWPRSAQQQLLATAIALLFVCAIGFGGYALVRHPTKQTPETSAESRVAPQENHVTESRHDPVSPGTSHEPTPMAGAHAEHPEPPGPKRFDAEQTTSSNTGPSDPPAKTSRRVGDVQKPEPQEKTPAPAPAGSEPSDKPLESGKKAPVTSGSTQERLTELSEQDRTEVSLALRVLFSPGSNEAAVPVFPGFSFGDLYFPRFPYN